MYTLLDIPINDLKILVGGIQKDQMAQMIAFALEAQLTYREQGLHAKSSAAQARVDLLRRDYLEKVFPRVSTADFCYTAKSKQFTAEASDIKDTIEGFTAFYLVSAKTGRELFFEYVGERKNRENEVEGWIFRSQDHGADQMTVFLIND